MSQSQNGNRLPKCAPENNHAGWHVSFQALEDITKITAAFGFVATEIAQCEGNSNLSRAITNFCRK